MAEEPRKTRGRPRGSVNRTSTVRRARRAPAPQSGGSDPASALLQSVQRLVSQNQGLVKENERLKALLTRISGLAGENAGGAAASAPTRRRRRSAAPAAAETPAASRIKRTRKPITDPVALERRRNALAKARAVRAERLRNSGA